MCLHSVGAIQRTTRTVNDDCDDHSSGSNCDAAAVHADCPRNVVPGMVIAAAGSGDGAVVVDVVAVVVVGGGDGGGGEATAAAGSR